MRSYDDWADTDSKVIKLPCYNKASHPDKSGLAVTIIYQPLRHGSFGSCDSVELSCPTFSTDSLTTNMISVWLELIPMITLFVRKFLTPTYIACSSLKVGLALSG